MYILDLTGEPIKKNDIKDVVDELSLKELFIRADAKGFRTILNLYKEWLSIPQFSAGTVFVSGAYLETGGEFVMQTGVDWPSVVNFYDTDGLDEGSVVAQIINYN